MPVHTSGLELPTNTTSSSSSSTSFVLTAEAAGAAGAAGAEGAEAAEAVDVAVEVDATGAATSTGDAATNALADASFVNVVFLHTSSIKRSVSSSLIFEEDAAGGWVAVACTVGETTDEVGAATADEPAVGGMDVLRVGREERTSRRDPPVEIMSCPWSFILTLFVIT